MSGLFEADPPIAPDLADATLVVATPASQAPYRVLARAYRPTRFADLIGQEAMVRTLRNAFALGRVAHAFMLTGVRGVGKTTTARIIARCLTCIGADGTGGPTADPCGVCPNCQAILADRHPDVVEMDAASRTGIDDVREIIEATRFRPMQARQKVFVIDEVHMLSRNAFNALLKTLEEPPSNVTFIFATTELRKVPVTVLSRCQRFDLRRVRVSELAALFARVAAQEGASVTAGALDLIARAADGSVRDGLSLLDQAIAQDPLGSSIEAAAVADMLGLADRGALFDLFEAAMTGDVAAVLAEADRSYERGADLGSVLAELLELTHTLTRLRSVPALRTGDALPEAERTRGAALADRLSIPVLARAWQMLLKGVAEIEQAPDRRAASDMVLIRLCHLADVPPPGELARLVSVGATSSAQSSSAQSSSAQSFSAQSFSAQSFSAEGSADGPRPSALGLVPRSGATGTAALARVLHPAETSAEIEVPSPSSSPPLPASAAEIAALLAGSEPMLHAHLQHARLVRLVPPVIELQPDAGSPRDFAARLAAVLSARTGERWTVVVAAGGGGTTLAEQAEAEVRARLEAAATHPLVCAILEAFPGARLAARTAPPIPSEPELPGPVALDMLGDDDGDGEAEQAEQESA